MKSVITIIFLGLIIFIQYILHNPETRCSKFGKILTDNILGFDYNCPYEIQPYLTKENKLNNKVEKKESTYNVSSRFTSLQKKNEIECKANSDVILVIGQSLAANSLLSNNYKLSKHANYFNGNCYLLTNPVIGATGNLSSIVPAISSKIKSKKNIIFVTNAWGGTSITEWSQNNSLTNYAKENLDILEKKGHKLSLVIWIQGEADSFTNIDYVAHFKKMKNIIFNRYDSNDIKFIITQNSVCSNLRDINLNMQQKKIANSKNFFITEGSDNLDMNYRYDGCHLNKFGTEIFSDEIAKIINEIFK